MIIERLQVKRFGGHEAIDFACNSPVVGIFGKNGAGKSTLLEALKFAITGETEESLSSYVKNLTGSGMVLVKFRKNGKQGSVERNIGTKTTRFLDWDGQKLTAAKQVTQTMREIFSADKKAIANAVFISQGKMQGMLFCGNAERRDGFIDILNLSFCEARADLIMRRVSKLQSTMVDLMPTRDAALAQRDVAAEAYLTKKSLLETSYDWTTELEWLSATATARAERDVYQSQLNQAVTDYQIKSTELNSLLQQFQWPSVEDGEALLKSNAQILQNLENDLNELQSVRADLSHYDRVSADIAKCYQDAGVAGRREHAVDPEAHGVDYWRKRVGILAGEEKTAMRFNELQKQIEEESEALRRLQAAPPTHPGFDEGHLQILATELAEAQLTYSMAKRNLDMQLEIAACFGAGGSAEGLSRCPKCDLTITDANRLSPSEIAKMQAHVADLQVTAKQADADHKRYSQAWGAYREESQRYRTTLSGCQQRIQKATVELQALPKVEPLTCLTEAKNKAVTVVSELASVMNEKNAVQKRMLEKMAERNKYVKAVACLHCREQYTDARLMELTQQRIKCRELVGLQTAQLAQINTVRTELKRLTKQQGMLKQSVDGCEKIMQADMTAQLKILQQELPDPGLLRAEVGARHQQYRVLAGQIVQLEETYTAANKAFQEIETRLQQDEKKRVLIGELIKLKDLLSSDGLPLAYARLQFETLTRLTQEGLSKLEAQFSIDVDRSRDLAFTFKRLDRDGGVELPMSSLSAGQRARLCVAFLMAVQKHLVPDVGLLVLDEPTTNVDAEGRVQIAEFLAGMAQELGNSEMQIWVCDHSIEVQSAISCKLELN